MDKYRGQYKEAAIFLLLFILISCHSKKQEYRTWSVYGGGKENMHYSSLDEADTNNVSDLQPAWVFHCGDADSTRTQIQVNPIIIDTVLYGVSPRLKLFALDAATGKQLWLFDPVDTTGGRNRGMGYFSMNVCRGIASYADGKDHRLFYAAGSLLYGINASNGMLLKDFGNGGYIDLHSDLGERAADLYVAMTSPGIIYKDMIIIGSRVAEESAAAPGFIRAYDVHTGKLRWLFHTIPQPGEAGYDSWDDPEAWKHIGGANAWAGFSLDEEKGIVFAPIGSASYDFFGGKRTGNDLFANSILALDANTGKRIWHFQTVHHDVWDRDLPAAPVLVKLNVDGKTIEAIAQITKSGFIFLFDRKSGKPVFPVKETPVPQGSELIGEKLSATQPIPTFPKPFVRQRLSEEDLNSLVPEASLHDIRKRLISYSAGNLFSPPSKRGTVIFPGYDGGGEWGGPSFDPVSGVLYINASEMPWILTMVDVKNPAAGINQLSNLDKGKLLYASACMGCHGPDRKGAGNYPSIEGVSKKYDYLHFKDLLGSGRRMMPAFKQLTRAETEAIASFILDKKELQDKKFIDSGSKADPYYKLPYTSTGYNKFLTREGYPAVNPPWGSLQAIELSTGRLLWKDTLGDYPELKARGIHSGTENYGGSAVTAGGLLFIAATSDSKFRAFNKRTGQLLWEKDLPAPGFATPSVYEVRGRQFIVIACGGGKLGKKSGDAYIAFALPQKK